MGKSENLITTDGRIGICRGVVGWGEDGIREGGSGDGNGGGDGSACMFSILLFAKSRTWNLPIIFFFPF